MNVYFVRLRKLLIKGLTIVHITMSSIFFFWPSLWHVEIPKPGIKPLPWQPSKPLQRQHQILNLLHHKRTPNFLIQSFIKSKQFFKALHALFSFNFFILPES